MSCERATVNEEYRVVVQFPKTFAERRQGCANALGRACAPCAPLWKLLCYIFFALFALSIFWSFWWIIILVSYCQKTPGLGLEGVSIRDMVLYQNSTTGTGWLARSDISVNLSTWNPNTVAGCFTTYRRMVVQVSYKDQLLLRQEVPLGFKLKPRGKRPVALDLQGDGYTVQQDLGALLQVELRNASAVDLDFSFYTRFLRNDHKAGWFGMCCDLVAKAPQNSSSSGLNSTGGLVWSSCGAC